MSTQLGWGSARRNVLTLEGAVLGRFYHRNRIPSLRAPYQKMRPAWEEFRLSKRRRLETEQQQRLWEGAVLQW